MATAAMVEPGLGKSRVEAMETMSGTRCSRLVTTRAPRVDEVFSVACCSLFNLACAPDKAFLLLSGVGCSVLRIDFLPDARWPSNDGPTERGACQV